MHNIDPANSGVSQKPYACLPDGPPELIYRTGVRNHVITAFNTLGALVKSQ